MTEHRNHFLEREERKKNLTNSHRRAKKMEASLAKQLKAELTPASGAGRIKGDVRKKGVLRIEAKTTKNKSFSVTLEMVEKILEAAAGSAELPAIVVEFNDGFGRKIREVAIVPTYVLEEICEVRSDNEPEPKPTIRRRR